MKGVVLGMVRLGNGMCVSVSDDLLTDELNVDIGIVHWGGGSGGVVHQRIVALV